MMDALDRRIVAALQRNGALSHPELAEEVGSTAPSCWRRVKQLEERGVLGAVVRLADRKTLGQNVLVICHVRIRSHSEDNIMAFADFVRKEPRVMECYSMSGEWDYLLQVVAGDVAEYEHFLMQALLKHPSVAGASSHFTLRLIKYETALPVKAE